MTHRHGAGVRLLRFFTAACLLIFCLRLLALVTSLGDVGQVYSWDLRSRHAELRLLEQGHYPRAEILRAEGIASPANSVYPPNAFPWLWLLAPFADFRLNQFWLGAWSLAGLGFVLGFAWSVGAAASRLGGLACVSAVLAMASTFSTFKAGQYGWVQLALMLGMTLALYRGRAAASGLLFGIALFKPSNIALMLAVFLRERRYAALAIAALVVAASAAAVSLWSGHSPLALLGTTYPSGGMLFTGQGYSLVTLLSGLGLAPRLASLLCAVIGFAALFLGLRCIDVPRDPLLVLALTGFVTRISLYHRYYDDLLLVFLLLACLRLWITAPSWPAIAATLAVLATLLIPDHVLVAPPHLLTVALLAVWTLALFVVLAHSPRRGEAGRPC